MTIDQEIKALNDDERILRNQLERANFYLERVNQISKQALVSVLVEIVCGQISIDMRKSKIANLRMEKWSNAE
jgi:hypothetical protein